MPDLSESVVGETKLIIWERGVYIELLLRSNSDLKFMLSAWVGDDFPIVHALHEWAISYHSPEVVVWFTEEQVTAISAELDFSRGILWIPSELLEFIQKTIHELEV